MPYQLVVIKGRSSSQAVKLNAEGVSTVGRQDGCQIRISSSQVSRKHCELFEKKGLLLVKDLNSSNGTFVNGKKIEGQQVLEPGNMLTIGSITFRIERTDIPGASTDHEPSGSAVGAGVGAGGEDDIEIEFDAEAADGEGEDLEIEFEDKKEAPAEPAQPASAEAKPSEEAPKPEGPAEDELPLTNEDAPELGEDAVAEYLLNIDLDDEDKL